MKLAKEAKCSVWGCEPNPELAMIWGREKFHEKKQYVCKDDPAQFI
jgi:hypothetical protein